MSDPDEVIPPPLFERRCDGGRSEWYAEDIMKFTAQWAQQYGEAFVLANPYYPGCGARFQWYGFHCNCPRCGRAYEVRMENIRLGKYAPTQK